MEVLFLKILNMSISAVWIVLAVVLLRVLLKKAPKTLFVALWAIVALRLVFPLSLKSSVSLIPSAETIPESIVSQPFTEIHTGFDAIDNRVNDYLADRTDISDNTVISPEPEKGEKNAVGIITTVWLCGIGAMALYFLMSYTLLDRKVRASVNTVGNVYVCDDIASPFILGVIKPKIYLPSGLTREEASHILAHERSHIKRLDHLWKPFGFAVLTVHWFNPAVWLAYILLCRDIEFACDEKVIKKMDCAFIKSYSETLLKCSVSSSRITACPIAFGEVSVKERIKTVLNYKKPKFWIIVMAVLACAVTAAVFLTNPLDNKNNNSTPDENNVPSTENLETEDTTQPPDEPSVPVDNTVYDISFFGYSTPTAYFVDFSSPLYNTSLNYREVTDKTVYSCPLHKFSSYEAMKSLLEPYKTSGLVGMDVAVDRLLEQSKSVFENYDTVFVAYVKSYNSEISFYPSSLKKQGNKLSFGISSKGPEVISDNQSGWFVLYGVKESDVEGCSFYSATVTDREFFVIPPVKTEAFKINKTFELDDDVYTNALNAPYTVNGSQYELPVYLFRNAKELRNVFGGTERLTADKDWTAKYNDSYFENKALFVGYFTAPSDSHFYGLSDSGYTMLRTELTGAFLYLEAVRTDAPNQEETDMEQGWIILLETDSAHIDRENLTVYAFVEYNNTRRH